MALALATHLLRGGAACAAFARPRPAPTAAFEGVLLALRAPMRRWVALAVALALLLPRVASAQCGAKSSTCRACHEVKKEGPAFDGALPGIATTRSPTVPLCHGGDGQAKEAARAHDGRTTRSPTRRADVRPLSWRRRRDPERAPAARRGFSRRRVCRERAAGQHGPLRSLLSCWGCSAQGSSCATSVGEVPERRPVNVLRRREWSPYRFAGRRRRRVARRLRPQTSGAGAEPRRAPGVLPIRTRRFFAYVTQSGLTWDVLVLLGGLAVLSLRPGSRGPSASARCPTRGRTRSVPVLPGAGWSRSSARCSPRLAADSPAAAPRASRPAARSWLRPPSSSSPACSPAASHCHARAPNEAPVNVVAPLAIGFVFARPPARGARATTGL